MCVVRLFAMASADREADELLRIEATIWLGLKETSLIDDCEWDWSSFTYSLLPPFVLGYFCCKCY